MRGDAGEQAKDGKPCLRCGSPCPKSLGFKPRKYCTHECCRLANGRRLDGRADCSQCGSPIEQPKGKGCKRKFCSACLLLREKTRHEVSCVRCGCMFKTSSLKVRFCSEHCRWPNKCLLKHVECKSCRKPFKQKWKENLFCSNRCSLSAKKPRPRKVYQCLYCSSPFYRQAYNSANKYCSRECAFDAKRDRSIKHPFQPLVSWLMNWGADTARPVLCSGARNTSHKARCERFGVPYEPIDRDRVFSAAGWACGLCGCDLLKEFTKVDGRVDPRSPTIDCIVPLAAGPGSPGYVYGNVQACCHACNVRKSDSIEPVASQTLH